METFLKKEKMCSGCLYFSKINGQGCSVIYVEGYKPCPCSTCLIKMVCKTTCKPFFIFQVEALHEYQEILKNNYPDVKY